MFRAKKYGTGWVVGWMGGWMEAEAGLRIAYSNQKDDLDQNNELFSSLEIILAHKNKESQYRPSSGG